MPEASYFPTRLILAAAMMSGMLLALAVHMISQGFGLDLGVLWKSASGDLIPASAALAWWLVAMVAFVGGYTTASLMHSSVSGQIPPRMRQFLVAMVVVALAAAGQAASGPSPVPTIIGVIGGLASLCVGAVMAFSGAHFALRRI